jgi:hypothetical protein
MGEHKLRRNDLDPSKMTLADQVYQRTFTFDTGMNNAPTTDHEKWLLNKIHFRAELLRNHLKTARRMYLDKSVLQATKDKLGDYVSMPDIAAIAGLAYLPFETIWIEYDPVERHAINHQISTWKDRRQGYLLRRRSPDQPENWYAVRFLQYETDDVDTMILMPCACCVVFGLGNEGIRQTDHTDMVAFQRDAAIGWGLADVATKTIQQYEILNQIGRLAYEPYFWSTLIQSSEQTGNSQGMKMIEQQWIMDLNYIRGDILWLISFLALINYVDVTYREAPPAGQYYYNRRNCPYLANRTVTINVSANQMREYVDHQLQPHFEAERRRAHEVRGHWRHYQTSPHCDYTEHRWEMFDEHKRERCQRCGTRRVWIEHHIRGDASLGFVEHNYRVVT